ncbi:hypothetical protein [Rhodococcus sp. ACT016]|uniref:hypothetical protein n=1 Tax=Rhodococcus sp. ACT016 TaxID=3134808 RepID=UPI003D27E8C6
MAEHARSSGVSWAGMVDWLVESLTGQPVAFMLEMGPNGYRSQDEFDEIACAQITMLEDGVLMLRRSRSVLDQLILADYSVDRLSLDRWFFDDHFADCTDGYLFTRDVRLVADACVAWFRDEWGTRSTDDLGCDYRFPDELPRNVHCDD